MDNTINDYDIVWWATDGCLAITCVKQVQTPFKRVNPKYPRYIRNGNPNNEPTHIHGIADKFCMVTADCYNRFSIQLLSQSFHTTRIDHLGQCVLIDDPTMLNSALAQALREKARTIKK